MNDKWKVKFDYLALFDTNVRDKHTLERFNIVAKFFELIKQDIPDLTDRLIIVDGHLTYVKLAKKLGYKFIRVLDAKFVGKRENHHYLLKELLTDRRGKEKVKRSRRTVDQMMKALNFMKTVKIFNMTKLL